MIVHTRGNNLYNTILRSVKKDNIHSFFKFFRIKKSLLTKTHLAIDCQWGEWDTGKCSADCGDGTRTNTREKIVEEDYGGACNGTDSQNVPCKEQECIGLFILMT